MNKMDLKRLTCLFVFTIIVFILTFPVHAQFAVNGQIMQRGEYLHGYGTLLGENTNPGVHIGQRSRLNFSFAEEKFKAGVSIQDVRIWGNTPQLKMADGFLSVHEAWAEYNLTKNFSFKLGRQELDYDDARFLGNLDWALQARAHDIALLKYETDDYHIHGGAAFNQEGIKLSGNFYGMQNQYKAAQFIRYQHKANDKLSYSVLFWNNGLQYLFVDEFGVRFESIKYSQTIGLPKIEYKIKDFKINAFYYHQLGKDGMNRDLNAFDASAEVSYLYTLNDSAKRKLLFTTGTEMLSGTSQLNANAETNNSYTPFFGTNHRFNGYMDYFYVNGRHQNSAGLLDLFVKMKYDFNTKCFAGINAHYFNAAADIENPSITGEKMDAYLGTEIDFTFGLILSKSVSLQIGYSQIFATKTMEVLRGGDSKVTNNWGYLMMLYRPGMDKKFTGLKF